MKIKDIRTKLGKKAVQNYPIKVPCPASLQRRIARNAARFYFSRPHSVTCRLLPEMFGVFKLWNEIERYGSSRFRRWLFKGVC